MASIVFSSPSQQAPTNRQTIDNLTNQIMSSINPQDAFNQMVGSRPEAKNAMDIVNQYGNGDPKTAFMNYAKSQSKEIMAKNIMSQLGLG